jgi:thiol:disulfide interchange protein DsbD
VPEGQAFHLPDSGDAPSSPAADSGSSSSSALDVLKRLTQGLAGSEDQPEFLPPDAAFILSADAEDADTVVADWQIADGYYLYRSKMRFSVSDPAGIAVGEPGLPEGKTKVDEYFGEMEVYYEQVQATLPLQRQSAQAEDITLEVVYQGCADAGLCYPPITKQLSVSLPAALQGAAPAPGPGQAVELPEQDRIARSLAGGNLWLVMLGFLGLGLLLTFTPCVFPMIPILSSILVGQGDTLGTRRAFTLSLTYVLAMAATYTVAGVLAGLMGANLQAAFQNPWILGAFIVVFVLLALSMFGLYDLQIPARWQAMLAGASNRQQGGTYVGVGIMGFLSALIVGPCVAAPLAGALIYIGQTGDAVLGGLALFALSIGMGLPVLAVGTSAGKLLPKAGPWMDTVKTVFGIVMLGVAIYLAERMVPAWVGLLLWGTLLVMAAIHFGALDKLTTQVTPLRRLRKGMALVMLLYGVALVVGGFSGSDNVWRPLDRLASGNGAAHEGLEFRRVKGLGGVNAAVAVAVAQGKPVMLDFYADWCVSCKEMERYTFRDADVQTALAGTILLQTDVTANDAEDQALLKHFNLFGPPAILFFGPDGRERPAYRVVGYMKAPRFREVVEKAIGGKGQLSASSQRQSQRASETVALPSTLRAE